MGLSHGAVGWSAVCDCGIILTYFLIVEYNVGSKSLLQQGISKLIFYGDLIFKFKFIV